MRLATGRHQPTRTRRGIDPSRAPAFTLVELIVVMSIMVTTIGRGAFVPRIHARAKSGERGQAVSGPDALREDAGD